MRALFALIASFCIAFCYADAPASSKKVIILDAGHGGHDVGAKARSIQEKKLALLTTLLTKKYLDQMGYKVILTRSRDVYLSLQKRVAIANKSNANVFVSIHYNASRNTDAKGVEVYYCHTEPSTKAKASSILASMVLQNLVSMTDSISRGTKKAKFHVIRETQMPSILIEAGFITNQEERDQLRTRAYVEKVAQGVAQGIDKYLKS